MLKRVNIVIAEVSEIVKSGVILILQRATNLNINIAEISNATTLESTLSRLQPNIIIINPSYFAEYTPSKLRDISPRVKVIALQNTLMHQTITNKYDGVIALYDSPNSIYETLSKVMRPLKKRS